jgi:hypothetical protein
LADARKLGHAWPEIFLAGQKDLPFDHYRRIAVCGLPQAERDQLRGWAEDEQPTRATLRQRIRDEIDAHDGIFRPDFELKVSNFWKFNSHADNGGYGSGSPIWGI